LATGSSPRATSRSGHLRRAEGESAQPVTAAEPQSDEAIDALCRRIQQACLERGLTLSTAESCTGGLVGHLLTDQPGSSGYYRGGLISYSNDLKQRELAVPLDTIEQHGAVSAQACMAMAEGARRRYGSDLAVAVTGIAGPDGGTAEKPVGTAWIGLAARGVPTFAFKVFHPRNRHDFKLSVSQAALEAVRRALL
jgi:nicotinamide-nucleotide amidase